MTYRILLALQLSIHALAFLQDSGGEASGCAMDACTVAYDRTMEYEGIRVGRNERYCEVMSSYRSCLNETADACRGELHFHSTTYFSYLKLKQYDCDHILARANAEGRQAQRCRLPPPFPSSSLRHCAMWGDPHIRTFDTRVHSCAEVGARPLIDNRFLLVQVSSGRVREDSMVTAVSKITVIVREHN
ncbi:hypothetical protein PMAYCL1PPCAC_26259, partial [Pristionchus mayeri]